MPSARNVSDHYMIKHGIPWLMVKPRPISPLYMKCHNVEAEQVSRQVSRSGFRVMVATPSEDVGWAQ